MSQRFNKSDTGILPSQKLLCKHACAMKTQYYYAGMGASFTIFGVQIYHPIALYWHYAYQGIPCTAAFSIKIWNACYENLRT